MPNEDKNIKICKIIQEKKSVENLLTFYTLAKFYSLDTIAKSSFTHIERCFQSVAESQNFLHLNFGLVEKILNSSELNIHSEVEVFDAANSWLKHKIEERSRYAKQLLLTVRLTLLSDQALKQLLDCSSSFTENNECVEILNAALENKKNFFHDKSSTHSRYCNQNEFNVLICGGYDGRSNEVVRSARKIDAMKNVQVLPSMAEKRRFNKAVCLKGEVYVLDGCGNANNWVNSIEKYSPSTETWSKVAVMFDNRRQFAVCAFMDTLFVFGGYFYQYKNNNALYKTTIDEITNQCLKFHTKEKRWKKVCGMYDVRSYSACAVFQGNIVVAGGFDASQRFLDTVESYDVFADKWTTMPSMIHGKCRPSLAVVKNKLFAIGHGADHTTSHCEVLDNERNQFVVLARFRIRFDNAISVGNKILVFNSKRPYVLFYDVDKNESFEEPFETTRSLVTFSSVKIPW